MEEILIEDKKRIGIIEKLIIIMMFIVAFIGIMISEIELKIISGLLFITGGLFLFFSIKEKRKKQSNNDQKIQSKDDTTENIYNNLSSSDDSFEEDHSDDFVIVKSIPNHKKKKSFEDPNQITINENISKEKTADDNIEIENNIDSNNISTNVNTNNVTKTSTFDLKKNNIVFTKDPKSEFGTFLNNILSIIKETVFAHSVLFFWVDLERKAIVFDSCVTSSSNISLNKKDNLEFGDNLVSKVALSGKAEIVTNINPDSIKDLLCYYKDNENIHSVIAIPIFFEDSIVAVLVVDSLEEDAYGPETINQLNSFITLLSSLINYSTEKYEYYNDSRILKKLESIYNLIYEENNVDKFILNVSKEIRELIDWDYSALILNESDDWIVVDVNKRDPLKSYAYTKMKIDINNSLVGNSIKENKFTIVEDITKAGAPRFNQSEKILNNGSLIIMPIYSLTRTFGAMIFEISKIGFYTTEDANLLNKICKFIASYLEIVTLKSYIDNNITIDEDTGIYKQEIFLQKITDELKRNSDYNLGGVLLLLSIDKQDELIYRYGISGFNTILLSVVNILNGFIPSYDILGRVDKNVIGIFRIGLNIDDGKVFAEKVRKSIAANIINLDSKSFSVTVSIGFVEVQKFDNSYEMIDNCKKILNIALQEGGNRVKIN